jgi:hypothetical protein
MQCGDTDCVTKAKIYAHAKPTATLRALFEIPLKLPDVNHSVLRCIDKATPFPILCVLRYDGHSQPVAA